MKVLFIGGTGNISSAVSRLALEKGIDLYLLNRGVRAPSFEGAKQIIGDIHQPEQIREALGNHKFDAVVNWINFTEPEIERDLNLFRGKCGQYIFISSASAYQKPVQNPIITEATPLANPYWEYSRNKIACEERLMKAYREENFPITIVRPSHTYDTMLPVAIGDSSSWTLIDRMQRGLPVIVHGDGTSLWVMTHSEDFAKGFVGLLGHPRSIGQAYHITSDEVLNWDQIYQSMAHAVGVEANIIHIASDFIAARSPERGPSLLGDKAWSVIFDNSKIKSIVPEYKATIPFHLGIRRTMDWFQADPSRMTINESTQNQIDSIIQAYQQISK